MNVISGVPWNLLENTSGLSKRLIDQFKAISKIGLNVSLYAPSLSREWGRFKIFNLDSPIIKDNNPVSTILNSTLFSYELSKVIEKTESDVLHLFNTTTLYLKEKKFLFQTLHPTWAFIREILELEYPKNKRYLRKLTYYEFASLLEEKEFENTSCIVASSNMAKEKIVHYYGVERGNIHVIPAGIDPEDCFLNYEKKKSDLKIILFPNRVSVLKGFKYVTDAMIEIKKKFPKSIMIVTNRIDDFDFEITKNYIKKLKDIGAIAFLGFLPRDRLYQYYRMADICLAPSLCDDMTLTVLESVAHSTPVVATPNTGFSDIGKIGLEVPIKDSRSISDAVLTLLSDEKIYNKKRKNAGNVIKKYYLANIAERFKKIYEKIL